MVSWNNLDTVKAYDELLELWNEVEVKEVMAGESGAKRVAEYNAPIAKGLTFNYAARPVDDKVLKTLQDLADETQLVEKYEELYNGAVINTGVATIGEGAFQNCSALKAVTLPSSVVTF